MRTIKELVGKEEKVYIVLRDKATQLRFQSEAEKEGITFGDGAKPTDRPVDDIMALKADGTICFLDGQVECATIIEEKEFYVLIMINM